MIVRIFQNFEETIISKDINFETEVKLSEEPMGWLLLQSNVDPIDFYIFQKS